MVLEQCRQADSFTVWVPPTLGPSHPCCVGLRSLPPLLCGSWVPPTLGLSHPCCVGPSQPCCVGPSYPGSFPPWVPPTLDPSYPGSLPWIPPTLGPSHPLPPLLCGPMSLPPQVPPTPFPPSESSFEKHLTKTEIFANWCILSYISVQSKCRHQNWTCQFPHI